VSRELACTSKDGSTLEVLTLSAAEPKSTSWTNLDQQTQVHDEVVVALVWHR
jgi:hypothetical protein